MTPDLAIRRISKVKVWPFNSNNSFLNIELVQNLGKRSANSSNELILDRTSTKQPRIPTKPLPET